MPDLVGWSATALFAASYLFSSPTALRRCQALAAAVWIFYGILIRSAPVVFANLIVALIATASTYRLRKQSEYQLPDA